MRLDLGIVLQLLLAPFVDHQGDVDQPVDQGRETAGRPGCGTGPAATGPRRRRRSGAGSVPLTMATTGSPAGAAGPWWCPGRWSCWAPSCRLGIGLGQSCGRGEQRQASAGGEPLERSNHDENSSIRDAWGRNMPAARVGHKALGRRQLRVIRRRLPRSPPALPAPASVAQLIDSRRAHGLSVFASDAGCTRQGRFSAAI